LVQAPATCMATASPIAEEICRVSIYYPDVRKYYWKDTGALTNKLRYCKLSCY
jgi:hypothetical protein